jgi:hypothetical protein
MKPGIGQGRIDKAEQEEEVKEMGRSSLVALVLLGSFFLAGGVEAQSRTHYGYYACVTIDDLGRIYQYQGQKDDGAVEEMISRKRCIRLKGDLEVFVTDTKSDRMTKTDAYGRNKPVTLVKIRPKGDTREVWTMDEAIRKLDK